MAIVLSIVILVVSVGITELVWGGYFHLIREIVVVSLGIVFVGVFLLAISDLFRQKIGLPAALLVCLATASTILRIAHIDYDYITYSVRKDTYERVISTSASESDGSKFVAFPIKIKSAPFVGATSIFRFIVFDLSDELEKPPIEWSLRTKGKISDLLGGSSDLKIRKLDHHFFLLVGQH